MNVIWSEDEIRSLGVRTNVETAGAIFGMSRTQSYAAAKAGRFPVPVLPRGKHLVVPVAPILRLLGIDEDATGETGPAVDLDRLADLVAERVMSRLAAAMAGGTRADPLPVSEAPARLQSVANTGDADAAA